MPTKDAKSLLEQRKRAYSLTFVGPHGEAVLSDLATFCKANEPCFHPDPRVHALMEGRREVWLRVEQHLKLNPEQLLKVYTTSRKVEND